MFKLILIIVSTSGGISSVAVDIYPTQELCGAAGRASRLPTGRNNGILVVEWTCVPVAGGVPE